jgi:hypothetical protein
LVRICDSHSQDRSSNLREEENFFPAKVVIWLLKSK